MSIELTVEKLSARIDNYNFNNAVKPFVCGISGPQGSGKSYLAEHVAAAMRAKYPHLNIVQFLMDDLYLTHSQQLVVTERNKIPFKENRMLQGRGLPGTHDIQLALGIFSALNNRNEAGSSLRIPRYNKAAFNGEGDRLPEEQWTSVKTPVDVVVFEGWFNGFCSLDDQQLVLKYMTSDPSSSPLLKYPLWNFQDLNVHLKEYEQIWKQFDFFVLLATDSIQNVYTWRLQQEHAMIQSGKSGMSNDQVSQFVDRYMPMYELYYDKVCKMGCLVPGNNLLIWVDINRALLRSSLI